jgi:flagellar basal-body rod protein FlgG
MMANQEKLDAISNNISNVNTTGYKKINVSFSDLVYETLERNGYPITENGDGNNQRFTGTGVRTTQWLRDYRQGSLNETNTSTDLAIDGEGMFRLNMPNGNIAYSRAGSFSVDALGRIVDSKGNMLEVIYTGGNNADTVNFSKNNFTVDRSGNIMLKEGVEFRAVGRIPLYTAVGSDAFMSIGDSLFVPAEGVAVNESNDFSIYQGYTENSNVDLITEMTEMMLTQRAFELGSRGIKAADEMWQMANNIRGR